MKKFLIAALLPLILIGCSSKNNIEPSGECKDIEYSKTVCPHFDAKISIDVIELNSTHAAISWQDVHKIEVLLQEKKKFNKNVDAINSKK